MGFNGLIELSISGLESGLQQKTHDNANHAGKAFLITETGVLFILGLYCKTPGNGKQRL